MSKFNKVIKLKDFIDDKKYIHQSPKFSFTFVQKNIIVSYDKKIQYNLCRSSLVLQR